MTRPSPTEGQIAYKIGEWTVRQSLNRLERNGISVDLEPKLMDLLICLAERAGKVVSKEELLDGVWRVENVSDGTLSHAVADLRRALDDDARQPRYIETIRKRGYRLVARVTPDRRAAPRGPIRVVAAIALATMLAAGAWIIVQRGGDERSIPPRIVILPFENLGGDSLGRVFAAGLTDEIISRLAAVRGLQVVSRTTAFNYDSTGKSARDIGRELDVEYILEGAVRWGADRDPPVVRITPQLIRVEDDTHQWSCLFDRHPERILDVQSEIARQIVDHLDLRLAPEESEVVKNPPTSDPVAYRAFLEALERRGSFDPRDILTAAQMYQRAVEADPGFAQAWAGLAEANGALHHFGADRALGHCDTARRALDRARELAPEGPDTMRASAFFEYHCRGDAAAAQIAFQETLRSWPGDIRATTGLAFSCRRINRWEDAEMWFRRALELDPRNPTILWNLGQTLITRHRYEEGLAAVDRAIELGPDLRSPYFARCVALWLGWGDTRGAAEALEQASGPRDAVWHEYAFRNACYAGTFESASRLTHDAPPGRMTQLHRCLAATLTDAPEAASICPEAVVYYRAERDREPDALWPRLLLARACSLAGLHEEAETEAAAAVALKSIETDAIGHVEALLVQAQVLGRTGRTDEAVRLVEHLLAVPSHLSPARLRIDPEWASLRHHPRIDEIIHAAAPLAAHHGAPASVSTAASTHQIRP